MRWVGEISSLFLAYGWASWGWVTPWVARWNKDQLRGAELWQPWTGRRR